MNLKTYRVSVPARIYFNVDAKTKASAVARALSTLVHNECSSGQDYPGLHHGRLYAGDGLLAKDVTIESIEE